MEDLAIRDDVLEAENIIRGLAHRLKDANAALQAAEAAKQSLAGALSALHGSTVQIENLGRLAAEAIQRSEEAAQGLIQRSDESLMKIAGEMSRDAQSLRDLRGDIDAAARNAALAASAIGEIKDEMLKVLTGNLPGKVAEATATASASLSQEAARSREASEALHAHLQQTRAQIEASLAGGEESMQDLKREMQKLSAGMESSIVNLNNRMQEARVHAASQIAVMESSLLARVETTDSKATWTIVLQVILTALTLATGLIAVKLLMH
jgi:chromosome segregation ATPase